MVVNGDMAAGIGGWNDPAVVYVADGAAMTLSAEDGALKAEVTAGTNFFTPRFGQMNVPFENGKTYEITFEAKSSVEKEIALQVGELLPSAPWYNDFLPSAENIFYRTITTEWATYSYKFTMTQDNNKGGILFGLGTVNGNAVNATMHFDNITIEESQPDPDNQGPVFIGVEEIVEILIGSEYDPKEGVSASDVGFGDMTYAIVVEIFNSDNEKVTNVDTSQVGTYTVNYIVLDPLGNKSTASTALTVVDEVPEPEWIGYGMTVQSKAIVAYSGTTDAWWNNNAQLPLDGFDGTKTTATFDFVGVQGQEYVFKIEGGGKAVETTFTATGDMQQAVLDLSGLTETERNGLTLAVVFAKTLDGAGTIELFTVLEAEVSSDWLFYGMTGQNVVSMEYPAPDPNAWWNNNAQLTILEFEGTKDTVVFNFVGAEGVKYMFKIEGGGKAVEAPVVATGEMQAHSLSLTGLTESERAGLNLLIIFNMDATETTTLDLYSVEYTNPLTVSAIWDAEYSDDYRDYTNVIVNGVVAGLHDKGYILQDTQTGEMISVHDSTNTPTIGDEITISGQFNVSFDIARVLNVVQYSVLSQNNTLNLDTSNAVEIDFTNFDVANYQGKLVKVTGPWVKLYSGATSYARLALDEAGTADKVYDGAYIGLQNGANELNLSNPLSTFFTGLDTATEYANVTLYIFFYDSTSSYEKAVIVNDAFIVTE
jgi:hypothetical protein